MKRLRLLVIEDDGDDFELILRELRTSGYEPAARRVDDAKELTEALGQGPWDAIISDYSLPGFDAPSALAIVKAFNVDVPFLIVSGTVDEETAVLSMRAGAHDFLSKGKLTRLVPALERELREADRRRDTTRLREELVLSDRMASVGTLAAGVAHEINNPLAAVLANLEFALTEVDALDSAAATTLRATLADASEAAERVRVIVRDLKVFSHATDERVGPVDVHEVLETSLRMARNEVRHRARVERDYGKVPLVCANDARLGQVFLNLIVNAAHAIEEGDASGNEIRVVTRHEPDGKVAVEVHDTGVGIPPEIASRIFDAFFTTKSVGEGTGLGLAICHRIVASLDGTISVRPGAGGRGTTFRVLLPAVAAESSEPEIRTGARPAPPRKTLGKRSTIAIVDDDALITTVLKRVLGREHECFVKTPAELTSAIAHGERFDAILCDVMMPDLTGPELYARIATSAPDQAARVIFMTGGTMSETGNAFLGRVPNPCIAKPFQSEELRALVRRVTGD